MELQELEEDPEVRAERCREEFTWKYEEHSDFTRSLRQSNPKIICPYVLISSC